MTQRNRKLVGTLLILLLVVVWAGGATALYAGLLTGLPVFAQLLYFAAAGLGWFFPAAAIIRFMARPD
jgi:hypothetical protein